LRYETVIGLQEQFQLVQHAESDTTREGSITGDGFYCTAAIVTLLCLDDDDRKVTFIFVMQDGATGEVEINRAALELNPWTETRS
jgi:hypothetical protein